MKMRAIFLLVVLFLSCVNAEPIRNEILMQIVSFVRNTTAGCSAISNCHGNGRCVDTSLDQWECQCNTGYADLAEGDKVEFCATCAKDYYGYPNCQRRYPESEALGLCLFFFCLTVLILALGSACTVETPTGLGGLLTIEHLQFVALLSYMPSVPPYLRLFTLQYGWSLLDFRVAFTKTDLSHEDKTDLFVNRFCLSLLIAASIFAFYTIIGLLLRVKGDHWGTTGTGKRVRRIWMKYPAVLIVLCVCLLAPITQSSVRSLSELNAKNPWAFIALVALIALPAGFYLYSLWIFWKVHQTRLAQWDIFGGILVKPPRESCLTRFFNLDPNGEWWCSGGESFVEQFGVFFRFTNGKSPYLRCALIVRWVLVCVLIGWPSPTAYMVRHVLLTLLALIWSVLWYIQRPMISKGENNVQGLVYIGQTLVLMMLLIHYYVYRALESPEHDLLSVLCMIVLSTSSLLALFKPLWTIMCAFAKKKSPNGYQQPQKHQYHHSRYAHSHLAKSAAGTMMSNRSASTRPPTEYDGRTTRSASFAQPQLSEHDAKLAARKNWHANWRNYLMDEGPPVSTSCSVGLSGPSPRPADRRQSMGDTKGSRTPGGPPQRNSGASVAGGGLVLENEGGLQRHRGVMSSGGGGVMIGGESTNLLDGGGEDNQTKNVLADLIEVAVNDGTAEGATQLKRPGGRNPLARAVLRNMGATASTAGTPRGIPGSQTPMPRDLLNPAEAEADAGTFQFDDPVKQPTAPHVHEGTGDGRPSSAFSVIKNRANSGAEQATSASELNADSLLPYLRRNEDSPSSLIDNGTRPASTTGSDNAEQNSFWRSVQVQDPDWKPAVAKVIK
eukprot:TRINITY_DN59860_c0_g1_i1.p1 TRINITY_DN59860_c0_g1~~TRINITY_DN59860_c0_g1_i1.p1  ORF type:complete len:838 (+),score=19.23 TRINITY_DN59860_c0_g1_i1:30-2543(+)